MYEGWIIMPFRFQFSDYRKNGNATGNIQMRIGDSENHNLQEYTYKKITPCDVCSQVLRGKKSIRLTCYQCDISCTGYLRFSNFIWIFPAGHTRQGLRCRICKVNVHADCASQLPKCQVKQKLLRRQKSTSEIENRAEADEESE